MKRCYYLLLLATFSCSKSPEDDLTLVWDNERAVSVRIGGELLPDPPARELLQVHKFSEPDPILGDVSDEGDALLFTPVVAFTGGLSYEVKYDSRLVGVFQVPLDTTLSNPELMSIYPTADTVPENLLKMYFVFSEPMREGGSTKHIRLIRNNKDTLKDTFLDLQPELWNADATVLTLWLDPGRVKRDLIPNKTLGQPIEKASQYTLVARAGWRSAQGAHTRTAFTKSFYTAKRDETIPNQERWSLNSPASSTRDTLIVMFDEALDYKLITDAIHVLNNERRLVEGEAMPGRRERSFCFIPAEGWKKGTYALMIESRLEDLAGNNLARPFDRDLTVESSDPPAESSWEMLFNIQ